MPAQEIAIFGAGAWGTALGVHLAKNGHATWLWSNEPKVLAGMALAKSNDRYLPGVPFPPNLKVTSDLNELAQLPNWLMVIPSHVFSDVLREAWQLNQPKHIAWATKGLCGESGTLLHEAARAIVGDEFPLSAISGPSFAKEVAKGLPTAVTVASSQTDSANFWADCLSNDYFQCYTTTDLVGVQIGGAVKNILAIAAGMSDGLGYGANTRCALITRGLAEMTTLAVTLGAKSKTLTGLAGMGDLVLTCTDNQSRNRRFGFGLGEGKSPEEVKEAIGQVVEGIIAAEQVSQLAKSHNVAMPITQCIKAILDGELSASDGLRSLFSGKPVSE